MGPIDDEELKTLETDLAKEARAEKSRVGSLPKTKGDKRPKRRGADKVPRPLAKSVSMRNSKGAKSNGPTSRKSKERTS